MWKTETVILTQSWVMNFSDPVNVDEKWAGVFAKLAPIDPVLRSKALLFLAKVLVISVTCCSE